MQVPLRVLAVGLPEGDEKLLLDFICELGGSLDSAGSSQDAKRHLAQNSFSVVVADRDLPEGGWKALWNELYAMKRPPALIVSSPHADDHLWVEALNLGVFDVLASPFRRLEIQHAVEVAWENWRQEWLPYDRLRTRTATCVG